MRVLLDENLPRGLKRDFAGHDVFTVGEMGWSGASDKDLLRLARGQFDALITADRNLEYQQNVAATPLGIVVIEAPDTRVQTLRAMLPAILRGLDSVRQGTVVRVGTGVR